MTLRLPSVWSILSSAFLGLIWLVAPLIISVTSREYQSTENWFLPRAHKYFAKGFHVFVRPFGLSGDFAGLIYGSCNLGRYCAKWTWMKFVGTIGLTLLRSQGKQNALWKMTFLRRAHKFLQTTPFETSFFHRHEIKFYQRFGILFHGKTSDDFHEERRGRFCMNYWNVSQPMRRILWVKS